MARKIHPQRNEYRCTIERNQNGKYCVRVRARFPLHDWTLPVYFLASSTERALDKLEQAIQHLQHYEEKLWFWGTDRSDDPGLYDELLGEIGLRFDRRADFPRHAAALTAPRERPVPAFLFATLRRALNRSVTSRRNTAAASD